MCCVVCVLLLCVCVCVLLLCVCCYCVCVCVVCVLCCVCVCVLIKMSEGEAPSAGWRGTVTLAFFNIKHSKSIQRTMKKEYVTLSHTNNCMVSIAFIYLNSFYLYKLWMGFAYE